MIQSEPVNSVQVRLTDHTCSTDIQAKEVPPVDEIAEAPAVFVLVITAGTSDLHLVCSLEEGCNFPSGQDTGKNDLAKSVSEKASVVLVIDDDPNVQDLMNRLLSKEGFRVETASTGEQGLKKAAELNPDVITLDVMIRHPAAICLPERLHGRLP